MGKTFFIYPCHSLSVFFTTVFNGVEGEAGRGGD